MNSRNNRRLVALAFAVAVSALLQACAVTTGKFVPMRASTSNRSMTSNYDVTMQHSSTPIHHMAASGNGGASG